MAEDFSERSEALREQIGDLRMMQKDYKSAFWNYTQALTRKLDPIRLEINNKIDEIMPKLSLQNKNTHP